MGEDIFFIQNRDFYFYLTEAADRKDLYIPDYIDGTWQFAKNAFANIKNVENIYLHKTFDVAFEYDEKGYFPKLKTLKNVFAGNSEKYCDIDGVLFSKDKTELLLFPRGRKDKEYTVPNTVTKLSYSFYDCRNLQKVTLPKGLKVIGEKSFYNCSNIEEITLPESVETIKQNAFFGTKISEVIGKSVTTMDQPFGDNRKHEVICPIACPLISLSKISNKNYKICFAMGYMLHKDLYTSRVAAAYEKYVNENSEIIYDAAKRHNIEKILNLSTDEVSISTADKSIGIEKMTVAEAKELFDIQYKTSGVKILRYKGNEKIVCIPKTIGKTEVTLIYPDALNDDVVVICGEALFPKLKPCIQLNTYDAILLEKVYVDLSFKKTIEAYFLAKYESLLELAVQKSYSNIVTALLFLKKLSEKQYELLIEKANSVSDPQTLANIIEQKNKDFPTKSHDLLDMDFSEIDSKNTIPDTELFKYTEKGDFAIIDAIKKTSVPLTEICIPDVIGGKQTKIETNIFSRKKELKKVKISDGVYIKKIGQSFFVKFKELERIYLSKNITVIENSAFRECEKLFDVQLPENLVEIGAQVFESCTSLTEVRIPPKVQILRPLTFNKCSNLKDVYIFGLNTRIDNKAFSNCRDFNIHAPAGSYAEKFAKKVGIPFIAE